jgi:2,4-dienoyl-CoA reductase-like NADH-dependent reductase (Old Yellow Enzyme family)
MIMAQFPHLFSPLTLRGVTLRNRILSTGHDTTLPTDGTVNAALVAYHRARAKGGAGLIVTQVAGVHETARYTSHLLMATNDDCISGYRTLAEAVHAEGCAIFSQLFHPGREIMESADGLLAVAYAPSAVPNERFHVMPRALPVALIEEIVAGYASAAGRMHQAGLDGVEVVASHGYLPAQFLNPRLNLRDDAYGGSDANRQRFLLEVCQAIRAATDEGFVIGLRISGGERDDAGLTMEEAVAATKALEPHLDYVNVTTGTSARGGGAVQIQTRRQAHREKNLAFSPRCPSFGRLARCCDLAPGRRRIPRAQCCRAFEDSFGITEIERRNSGRGEFRFAHSLERIA